MNNFNAAILSILCCIVIVGCDSKRVLLRKDIKEFMTSTVHIPPMTSVVLNGVDTIQVLIEGDHCSLNGDSLRTSRQAPVSMVVLFDSTVCSSCKVSHMWEYQIIVDYTRTLRDGFEPTFIFAPSKNMEHDLRIALKGHPFEWPVFIDTEQKFLKANPHIPKNKALHTFLLDKNNRVVLVGDPIGNDKLWGLYMKTIRQLIDNDGVLPEESSGKRSKK